MTASTLTQLPLMAGSALLGSLGRAGQWTFARYMRAPLASTGLMALVTLTALAGSNALYFQTGHHPAPLFAPADTVASLAAPVPVPVDERPETASVLPTLATPQPPPAVVETTGSVAAAPAIPEAPVGNSDVFAVQKKLAELHLFDGTIDGYYGPKTANAIRAFELRNGLTPMGAMERSVIDAILNADSAGRVTTNPQPRAAIVAPAPQPAAVQQASLTPPPAPVAVPVAPATDRVVARLPALSPAEEAFDRVAQSAADTIDSIIAGLDNTRSAPQPAANPPIPTTSLPSTDRVAQTMPAPVMAPAPAAVPAPVQVADISPDPAPPAAPPATDTALVAQIQRGLASLGFFHAAIDGKPGPETARAIREFENFNRYKITGQVKPDLVGLLREAGAAI